MNMASAAEHTARTVLRNHPIQINRISSRLPELISRLMQIDRDGWRHEGHDLVSWMRSEADDMANAEKGVAISKITGGGVTIAGGVLTGVGVVASFFTFGLAAPLALAGGALTMAGTATSAGGEIAQSSISHMKTCKIKERCEAFGQKTEGVLSILVEMGDLMNELSTLCQENNSNAADMLAVIQIVLRSGMDAVNFGYKGVNLLKIAVVVYEIARLERAGIIFGADFLRLVGGVVTGSGLSISKALLTGAGTALGIGFGIWDVVDGAGTLQNGGSRASLIRDNASQLDNTVREIDNALRLLDL